MDRFGLYDEIARRKSKPRDFEPYDGNNGRVNRCAELMRAGRIRTGGTLLDVGGGIGDLGYSVRDLFEERITLDISHVNLYAARAKGNDVICVDVDKQGFNVGSDDHFSVFGVTGDSVDTVTALDFIEHIIDPENFARECHRVLKPGGEVFVNTPNIRFWRHIEQLWKSGAFPHTSGDREVFHGGHLAFYTYLDLRMIFEPAGFTSEPQFDDGMFDRPPESYVRELPTPKNQGEFLSSLRELGCPNLLYKAIVKK